MKLTTIHPAESPVNGTHEQLTSWLKNWYEPKIEYDGRTDEKVERNQQVLKMRNEGATYKELQELFGISSGRISQILTNERGKSASVPILLVKKARAK